MSFNFFFFFRAYWGIVDAGVLKNRIKKKKEKCKKEKEKVNAKRIRVSKREKGKRKSKTISMIQTMLVHAFHDCVNASIWENV